jgi:hypothetical protein
MGAFDAPTKTLDMMKPKSSLYFVGHAGAPATSDSPLIPLLNAP